MSAPNRSLRIRSSAQLLCLLSKAVLLQQDQDRARSARLSKRQWETLWELAVSNQVIPHIVKRVTELGLTKPPKELVEKASQIRSANTARHEKALDVLAELSAHKIRVVLLKGYLFSHALYNDPGYKKMNDVDILVSDRDFERASLLVTQLGFRPFEEFSEADSGQKKRHHNITLVAHDRTCVIGLHWRLTSKLTRWQPDMASVWERIVPFKVGSTQAFRMCFEDNLVHLALHLPLFKTGLRELADGANVISATPDFNWDLFMAHIEKARGHSPAYRYLRLTDTLGIAPIPAFMLDQLRKSASPFIKLDTDERASSLERVLASRSVWQGVVEKAFIRFKKASTHHERVKLWSTLWAQFLIPPTTEIYRLAPTEPKGMLAQGLARFAAPVKLFMALAQDYSYFGMAFMAINSSKLAARSLVLQMFEPPPKASVTSEDELILKMLE